MSFDHATSPCFHVHPVDAWNEPQTWVTWLWGGVTHLVGNEQLWYRARIRALGVTLADFLLKRNVHCSISQQKYIKYGVRKMLICFLFHMCFNFLVWKTQHSKGVEKHHSWSLEPHPTILWIPVYSKNPRKIRFILNWGRWIIFSHQPDFRI